MNSKTLIRIVLSMFLIVEVCATFSMVALAGTGKITGELMVSGKSSSVSVNGQDAQSGRTVFSASTITAPRVAPASFVANSARAGPSPNKFGPGSLTGTAPQLTG